MPCWLHPLPLKSKLLYILGIVGKSAVILAVLIGFAFIQDKQNNVTCTKAIIDIKSPYEGSFITTEDIEKEIVRAVGEYEGVPLNKIPIQRIELLIKKMPHVKNAEVYHAPNGVLNVQVQTRRAIARIINASNEHYYIDEDGFLFPISDYFTADVPVVTGSITESLDLFSYRNFSEQNNSKFEKLSVLDDIYRLASFIDKDTFWTAQIQQIEVDSKQEFTLTPTIGEHFIRMGTIENMELKFEKLLMFYIEGLNKTGWNKFTEINLKFNNQVVCRKKTTQLITTISSNESVTNEIH